MERGNWGLFRWANCYVFTGEFTIYRIDNLLSCENLSVDAKGKEERHPLRGVGHYEEIRHNAKKEVILGGDYRTEEGDDPREAKWNWKSQEDARLLKVQSIGNTTSAAFTALTAGDDGDGGGLTRVGGNSGHLLEAAEAGDVAADVHDNAHVEGKVDDHREGDGDDEVDYGGRLPAHPTDVGREDGSVVAADCLKLEEVTEVGYGDNQQRKEVGDTAVKDSNSGRVWATP